MAEAGRHWKHTIVKTLIHTFKSIQEANWLEDPILFIVKSSRKQDFKSPAFSPQRNSNFMSHHPMISLQGQIRKGFCSSPPFLATQRNFLTIKRCPNQISICRQCIWAVNSRPKPEIGPFANFDWHALKILVIWEETLCSGYLYQVTCFFNLILLLPPHILPTYSVTTKTLFQEYQVIVKPFEISK